jgi:hypothetical protein
MIVKWNDMAVKTSSKVIALCGMDSILWDLIFYKQSQLVYNNSDDTKDDYLVNNSIAGCVNQLIARSRFHTFSGDPEQLSFTIGTCCSRNQSIVLWWYL